MKRIKSFFILATLLTGISGYAQTEETIQNMLVDYCTVQGYDNVIVDADGDVQFKSGDFTYFIGVHELDPDFANLVLANIWTVDSEEERTRVLEACHYVTANKKVIKAYIVNDNVWITCELFVNHPEDIRSHIPRGIEDIEEAVEDFKEKMLE